MSHFTVMIIGENPEDQLEPYAEDLKVDEYSRGLVSEEEKQSFIDYYTNKDNVNISKLTENANMSFDELYKQYGEDWNGLHWRKDENGQWNDYSTYNPNSKWDWYSLGGRWSGAFITKLKEKPLNLLSFELEGFSTEEVKNFIEIARTDKKKFEKIVSKYNGKTGTIKKAIYDMIDSIDNPKTVLPEHKTGRSGVFNNEVGIDQARKGDIDFDAIRANARDKAEKRFDEVWAVVSKHEGGVPRWNTFRDLFDTIEEAREKYGNLPVVKELRENDMDTLFDEINDIFCDFDKEKYIKRCVNQCFVPFAVLKNGKWYEKGEMGWFGISTNDKDQDVWNEEVNKMLDELPDDVLISFYDCHI